ncbi:hypothetical protein F2Q69_00032306 [Brassica cretica]|uniref:Uncharacterized protein n=1 Tax=Brassica cretica TaxID=69181 RepID=A0A8S9S0L5_BRACR|nr:hypothetical protein F2Q69_00032306 [Brassica cretica]
MKTKRQKENGEVEEKAKESTSDRVPQRTISLSHARRGDMSKEDRFAHKLRRFLVHEDPCQSRSIRVDEDSGIREISGARRDCRSRGNFGQRGLCLFPFSHSLYRLD